jgi:secreted trypsin-like serine protease
VGRYTTLQTDSQSIEIDQQIRHPNYIPANFPFDIMIITLKERSDKPFIKLNRDETVPELNTLLSVLGFGYTYVGATNNILPTVLQEASLNYMENNECDQKFGANDVTNDMLCASDVNKDAWYE